MVRTARHRYTLWRAMEQEHVYTISELNRVVRDTLESTYGSIWVKGEISELTRAPSGHLYFTLKDAKAEVSGVRFRSLSPILAALEVGTTVLAFGKLTVYEPRGRYQFVATLLQPVGAGLLQAAFERLKAKLDAEGLFAPERKRAIPRFPRRIAVITSAGGAALHDVVSVLQRRWPMCEVYLFPASVQGSTAPAELIAAMDRAERFSQSVAALDLVIVGRGGGSAEDLAAFNDEALARAIHAFPLPVVSAVGHEIDFSIADLVADVRAPTPSAAAELAVPDTAEIAAILDGAARRMVRTVQAKFAAHEQSLRGGLRASLIRAPQRMLETAEQKLDAHVTSVLRSVRRALRWQDERWTRVSDLLRISDPRMPLERGYSMTTLAGSTEPLRDLKSVDVGASIETRLARGRIASRIEEVNPE